jgi:hydroxylaminobenzene mutase
MNPAAARRDLLWHGFLLVILSLATGLFLQAFTNPRLGLAAHVGGIMNGTLIAVVGAIWGELRLGARTATVLFWATVTSGYANWAGLVFAAAWGTSSTTPLLGAGYHGTLVQEGVVAILLTVGGGVVLFACVLVLAGLRPRR